MITHVNKSSLGSSMTVKSVKGPEKVWEPLAGDTAPQSPRLGPSLRPCVEGGAVTCRLESCVKAFSQPGCAHLYGLSPVWILHGMRGERERTSARPLRDQRLSRPTWGTRRGSPGSASSGHGPNFCLLPMPHGSSWAPLRGWGRGRLGA